MRNNKAILDDAARSVRRTFIGSVAGSVAVHDVGPPVTAATEDPATVASCW